MNWSIAWSYSGLGFCQLLWTLASWMALDM